MNSALSAQLRGDLEDAAARYRQALLTQPENVDALHMLGVIHFMQGNLVEAEKLMRYADSLCEEPISMIQHNLMRLREKIAITERPTEPVRAISLDEHGSPVSEIVEVITSQEVLLPKLDFSGGAGFAGTPETSERKAHFSPIKTFVLENAVVDAESAIPANRTTLIVDQHFDPARHQSPEWRYGLYRMAPDTTQGIERTVCVDSARDPKLSAAIVLTSGHWINWAHFLTEVLPKALIADQQSRWRDWPMLISANALPNARELFRLLIAPDRRVVKANGRVLVDAGGFVSSVGFCPLEYDYDWKTNFPNIRPTDCLFSPYALNLVRTAATALVPAGADTALVRLYLRRNSAVRKFVNQDEVEREFRARGFLIVEPETLSVIEQIQLFSRATVIAGPTGAAIANFVFAPPGCRVLIIAAENRHWPFHYWLNMAHAAGHQAKYLFSRQVGVPAHPAHPDMYLDNPHKLGPTIEDAIARRSELWS